MKKELFEELYRKNLDEYLSKVKGGDGTELTYLSWAWSWAAIMKICPDATYEVVKFDGLPYVYDPKTGYMVYTRVTIEDTTHEMWLPVMNASNKAMKAEPYKYTTKWGEKTVEAATMFDINKTIMRCLVKNLAMFGLGLYIYAGEDLPESDKADKKDAAPEIKQEPKAPYPPRDEMLELVKKKYPEGTTNHDALLASFGVKSLDKASDAQLMVIWNKYAEK